MITETPLLYIIMRTDIPYMNPGKGMAQAAHAQALFDERIRLMSFDVGDGDTMTAEQALNWHFVEMYEAWAEEGDGFGTTLVLEGTLADMIYMTEHGDDILSDIVVDPTYPYRNAYGELFTVSAETCMYVFITPDTDEAYQDELRAMPLHR